MSAAPVLRAVPSVLRSDATVTEFLQPIQRVMPPIANVDLSPLVLILLLQIVQSVRLLLSLESLHLEQFFL